MCRKIAFLFPGQGAQYPSMGKDFYDAFPISRQTFDEADAFLGHKLSDLIFNGPEEELTKTKHSQLAIYVTSIAALRALQEKIDLTPSLCAGLSLGEYTALYASGKISFIDGLHLVRQRAMYMNDACEKIAGTMAVVLGLSWEIVSEVVSSLQSEQKIWIANSNCPGQIVISGTKEGIQAASVLLKEKGAKRIVPLQVHGAFHSGLMLEAQNQLASDIANAPILDTSVQLVMNVPGCAVSSIDAIRDFLTKQVTHSVLWEKGIRFMIDQDVDMYIEIGCGKTLIGMNRKIGLAEKTYCVEKIADLEQLAHTLETIMV